MPPSLSGERRRSLYPLFLRALVGIACAWPLAAFADLWAYVDAQGHSHLADHQVDKRYRLFFKGQTTLDVPDASAQSRTQAIGELEGTALYARATDPVLVAKYASLIEANARRNDVDPALVQAVVAAESGFDPRAQSDKGAVGLMQVLPDTAARYGLTSDHRRSIEEKLRDPATNLRIGARYLHDLLARFDGDLALALAAYNAGEGAVASHANRIPPFAETKSYVTRVQQLYAIYRPQPATPAGRVQIVKRYADVASE